MAIFLTIVILSIIGLGVVAWILIKDKTSSSEDAPAEELTPGQILRGNILNADKQDAFKNAEPESQDTSDMEPLIEKPKKNFFAKFQFGKKKPIEDEINFLQEESPPKIKNKFKLPEKLTNIFDKFKKNKLDSADPLSDLPESKPLPNLKDFLAKETIPETEHVEQPSAEETSILSPLTETIIPSQTDTPAPIGEEIPIGKPLSEEEEKEIENEINLTSQLDELKEKHTRLDSLFQEKSLELEKTKTNLENELKNRKEFNKIKDLLEKEIKEAKDKTKDVHAELNTEKSDKENSQKRINQLEEKITIFEKTIEEKNKEIKLLQKPVQAQPPIPETAPPPEPQKTEEQPPAKEVEKEKKEEMEQQDLSEKPKEASLPPEEPPVDPNPPLSEEQPNQDNTQEPDKNKE